MISEFSKIENSLNLINSKNLFFAFVIFLLIVAVISKEELFLFILGIASYVLFKLIRFQKAILALDIYKILEKVCANDDQNYRDSFINESTLNKPREFLPSLFIRGFEISYPRINLLELMASLEEREISSEVENERDSFYRIFMNDGSIFGEHFELIEFLFLISWFLIFYFKP